MPSRTAHQAKTPDTAPDPAPIVRRFGGHRFTLEESARLDRLMQAADCWTDVEFLRAMVEHWAATHPTPPRRRRK